jgi:hypothetical protein
MSNMDIAGRCNLPLPQHLPNLVRCQEDEECAVCGLCTKHCLQHFRLPDGLVHGRTVCPLKPEAQRVMLIQVAA